MRSRQLGLVLQTHRYSVLACPTWCRGSDGHHFGLWYLELMERTERVWRGGPGTGEEKRAASFCAYVSSPSKSTQLSVAMELHRQPFRPVGPERLAGIIIRAFGRPESVVSACLALHDG